MTDGHAPCSPSSPLPPRPPSYKTDDVIWVFGSSHFVGENVMMTVATSDIINGPTRLLFPRVPGSVGEASFFPFSLLGALFGGGVAARGGGGAPGRARGATEFPRTPSLLGNPCRAPHSGGLWPRASVLLRLLRLTLGPLPPLPSLPSPQAWATWRCRGCWPAWRCAMTRPAPSTCGRGGTRRPRRSRACSTPWT